MMLISTPSISRKRGSLDLYATFLFGRRVARWRPRAEAIADAIEAGHASRDEWGKLFWWIGAEMRRQA
jgi:hypothetical protein